jgi:hypothetical protein
VGYKISRVIFENGMPTADRHSTSATEDIFVNSNSDGCPSKCFRPVGLALDQEGRLFVSSDSTGEIFVLHAAGRADNFSSAADNNAASQGHHDGLFASVVSFIATILVSAIGL